MKRIIAVIKPNMLDDVIFALHQIERFETGPLYNKFCRLYPVG